jgi:hypothetical protein
MSQQPNNNEISIDERLMALLEISENQRATAEIQDQKFNELVETFAGLRQEIASNENIRADTFSNKATQAIIRIENIAEKISKENLITKEQLVKIISDTVTIYFAKNLAHNLSEEVKAKIQQSIGESVGDIIAKALQGEVEELRNEIATIRGELRAIANETKAIVVNINEGLKEGADEIVGNGVAQILQGVESATASYQQTVANLEKVAVISQKKAQPIFDGLENVSNLLRGKIFWFTGLFCFGSFLVSMVTAFIIYQIVVPTKYELRSRKEYLESTQLSLDYMNRALATRDYEWKDGRLYLGVDRYNCYDKGNASFCPAKSSK